MSSRGTIMNISGLGFALPLPGKPPGGQSAPSEKVGQSVEEQFLKYAQMSPAERIREAILKEMGTSEEDLQNMDPEARALKEKEIAERLKDKLQQTAGKQTGMIVDVEA
jgi:hypothetical protein